MPGGRRAPQRAGTARGRAATPGRRTAPPRAVEDTPARRRAALNAARRADLLERFADHLLDHGLTDLKLRPAAAALGTSARMLVHHFRSKEALLTQALAVVRTREVEVIARRSAAPLSTFDENFRASWSRLASTEFRRFLHLSYDLLALALRDRRRHRPFLERFTEEWRRPFAAALEGLGIAPRMAASLSTAYTAALRGLLLDLLVTGDRARIEAAVALVADRLRHDIERLAR